MNKTMIDKLQFAKDVENKVFSTIYGSRLTVQGLSMNPKMDEEEIKHLKILHKNLEEMHAFLREVFKEEMELNAQEILKEYKKQYK